jgi:predicted ATPase/class 3 adenylate cyclase
MLFSDIEGSTRLLQQLGDAYGDVLLEHHAVMRAAFAKHAGDEQGTEGDSFFVLFPTASNAVAAALDAQLALAAHPWPDHAPVRVRMGVHVGPIKTVGGTIVGMAVHEAARIGAAAHGGQVLASARAAELAGDVAAAAWRDLGAHTLKDIAAPIVLRQLTHAELRDQFPPPRSQGSSRNNLPAQASAFLGRQREVAEVTELLATTRVLTLTGAGGAGKSRLALRVAADAGMRFADGVFFVDLAPISEPDAIAAQIASALGLSESAADDLTDAIGHRALLLLVDNCEHLIAASAEVVDDIVGHCPGAAVLATSREPLGIAGEVAWRVPSLADDEAVALFVARATAANPTFELTDANRGVVADICTRLDAIPLALELAAGRLASLGVDQLADRLSQRFRLLTGGSRSSMARQRTLQATVDWSYELLDPPAQAVLRRLGVFVGGLSLEAAEFVCVDDAHGIDALAVFDHLDALVAKSLLVADHHDGVARYRLLETIRQYALDKLVAAGEIAAARDAHAAWVVTLGEEVERQLWWGGPDELPTMRRLSAEAANIRGAFDWMVETDQLHDAAMLISRLIPWTLATGRPNELRQWAERLGAMALSDGDRALVAFGEFIALSNLGGYDGAHIVERLARDTEAIGESARPDIGPSVRGYIAADTGLMGRLPLDEALARIEREVAAAASGPPYVQGMTSHARSMVLLTMGDLAGARAEARRSFELIEGRGFSSGESRAARMLANLASSAGELDEAWRWAEHGLAAARSTGDTPMIIASHQELAIVQGLRGDVRGAADFLIAAVEVATEVQVDWEIAVLNAAIAWYLMLDGDIDTGARYAWRGVELARPGALGFDCFDVAIEAARLVGDLPRAHQLFDRARAAMGATQDDVDITRVVALVDKAATLRLEEGDYAGAVRLFAVAETKRPATYAVMPHERERMAALLNRARAGLADDAAYDAAWAEGEAMAPGAALDSA